ncbi:MAG: rod shape-determining protein RodA [Candidatus Aminicenantes bacterium]|nr:rod shape-determining protein RodA [Candidatus Aminicenantes bacterium]
MLDRIHLREIDWILIGLLLANAAIGLLLIFSASHISPGAPALKQALWLLIALALMFACLAFDYKLLMTMAPYALILLLFVLGFLLAFGKAKGGAKSWIGLAFMGGQPSEMVKIAVLLLLARVFAEYKRSYVSFGAAAMSAAVALPPIVLVAMQPDMGTAMSILPIWFGCLALAGLNRKTLVILLVAAILLGFFGWNFLLHDYQKVRLRTVLNPTLDPRGAGYHVLQSKIAIGAGGWLGKGFLRGSQSQLRFLPARHTDFVFSVLGEEFGFVGVIIVLGLYFALVLRIFRAVGKTRDRAGLYIIFLVGCMITFPFLVNVFMIIGLFPITGIPIPLLSYGGSSLVSTFLAVGLVLNVKMRRFANV